LEGDSVLLVPPEGDYKPPAGEEDKEQKSTRKHPPMPEGAE